MRGIRNIDLTEVGGKPHDIVYKKAHLRDAGTPARFWEQSKPAMEFYA